MNVALKQMTWQSSTYTTTHGVVLSSSKAVDGSRDPNLNDAHCSHTNAILPVVNWWAVDLGQKMFVKYITVTNRDSMRAYILTD